MKLGWLKSRRILFLILASILVAVIASHLPTKEWAVAVAGWLKSLGFWEFPAFVVLYVVTTALGLPNVVLILVAGTLFGFIAGIISVSIADTLGAAVCYALGRTIARKRIKKLMERYPNFALLDRAVGRQGWKILLLSRLSPVIPSNVLNYGFSCTQVNFWHYLIFTWLGMLPVIGLYIYIGYFGSNFFRDSHKPETLALQAVGLGITVIAAVYTTRLAKKVLSRSDNAQSDRLQEEQD